MPKKPKKPCSYNGCPNLTDGRFCDEHAKAEMKRYNKYQRDPETNKRYGRPWKQIRDSYLAKHPLCELCRLTGKLTPATLVHHRRSLKDGGTNNYNNLASLCKPCHSRLHIEQGDNF